MIRLAPAALAALVLFLAPSARAGAAGDAVFVDHLFTDLSEGAVVAYRRDLGGAHPDKVRPVEDGRVILTAEAEDSSNRWDGPVLRMKLAEGSATRTVGSFPASGGNPVLIVFLESTVRNVAAETGGNPQYIRTRIREALQLRGEVVEAGDGTREAVFRPFEADPHAAQLGDFTDLTLRFTLSDAVPGRFVSLSADTGVGSDAYVERVTYMPEESTP